MTRLINATYIAPEKCDPPANTFTGMGDAIIQVFPDHVKLAPQPGWKTYKRAIKAGTYWIPVTVRIRADDW